MPDIFAFSASQFPPRFSEIQSREQFIDRNIEEKYFIKVYDSGAIEIKRRGGWDSIWWSLCPATGKTRTKREEITELSDKSARRMAWTAFNGREPLAMITLTYQSDLAPKSGKELKTDLNVFLQSMRRRGLMYFWFLEFQSNGSPHFHVLIDGDLTEPGDQKKRGKPWVNIAKSKDFSRRWAKIVERRLGKKNGKKNDKGATIGTDTKARIAIQKTSEESKNRIRPGASDESMGAGSEIARTEEKTCSEIKRANEKCWRQDTGFTTTTGGTRQEKTPCQNYKDAQASGQAHKQAEREVSAPSRKGTTTRELNHGGIRREVGENEPGKLAKILAGEGSSRAKTISDTRTAASESTAINGKTKRSSELGAIEASPMDWEQIRVRLDNMAETSATYETAKNGADGLKRYAVKYGCKLEQKTVPAQFSNVGRFWGCSVGWKGKGKVYHDGFFTLAELAAAGIRGRFDRNSVWIPYRFQLFPQHVDKSTTPPYKGEYEHNIYPDCP